MKQKATLEWCDNPDCGYSETATAIEPETSGYHLGKGYWADGGGGPIPAFYAHRIECVVPALKYVIEEARR